MSTKPRESLDSETYDNSIRSILSSLSLPSLHSHPRFFFSFILCLLLVRFGHSFPPSLNFFLRLLTRSRGREGQSRTSSNSLSVNATLQQTTHAESTAPTPLSLSAGQGTEPTNATTATSKAEVTSPEKQQHLHEKARVPQPDQAPEHRGDLEGTGDARKKVIQRLLEQGGDTHVGLSGSSATAGENAEGSGVQEYTAPRKMSLSAAGEGV